MIKAVHGSRGTRYMDTETNKFIKTTDVPSDILKTLQPKKELKLESKKCIFCGAHTNWSRPINNQSIYLCEEHYYSETIGKIVQKLRGLENVQEKEKR